jgi:hypothetical protein
MEARSDDDPVSERKGLDLRAKLLDVSDNVRADHMRKRNRLADGARTHQRVIVVSTHGCDLDEHVAWLRGRRRDLTEIQNIGIAKGGNRGGLYG